MSAMYALEDLDLANLRGVATLVRVDFNVPLSEGRVTDTTRLEASLPTLEVLSAAGARMLLASHCGRPKGEPDPRYSLAPVAEALAGILGRPVGFASDCVGDPVTEALSGLEEGGACLLENLRFHPGEKANDPEFSAWLAAPAAAYVDDAFGTAHRAHASVVGICG